MKPVKDEKRAGGKFAPVFLQTCIVAAIGAALTAGAQFIYPLVFKENYAALRFILGGVYGWLLGVLNFLGMGLSLILLTDSTTDKQEGQKKAQSMYMARLVVLLLLAVGGCFIPVFHPVAVLASLALTWTGVFVYSFIFKLVEAKRAPKAPQAPEDSADAGAEDSVGTQSAENENSEASEEQKDGN